jgi:hypothetical protein
MALNLVPRTFRFAGAIGSPRTCRQPGRVGRPRTTDLRTVLRACSKSRMRGHVIVGVMTISTDVDKLYDTWAVRLG